MRKSSAGMQAGELYVTLMGNQTMRGHAFVRKRIKKNQTQQLDLPKETKNKK